MPDPKLRVWPSLWLSPRGIAALAGLGALLALAGVFPWLLAVFGAALCAVVALLIADLVLGPPAATIAIERDLPDRLVLGQPAPFTYCVRNRARIAVRLGLVESPAPHLAMPPGELRALVPSQTVVRATLTVTPTRRGRVQLSAIYSWFENPVGLLRRRTAVARVTDLRVVPDLAAVERAGRLAHRATLVDAGLRKLRLRGAGNEFESLREYQTGDAFRAIDWKASARRGRTMVRQYEVERSRQVIVALDCGRLMMPHLGAVRKFDHALTAAFAVARIAITAGDQIGAEAFAAESLLSVAPRRGTAQLRALGERLFDLEPRYEEPDYERICVAIKQRYAKRSLIVLFTDLFDPAASTNVLAGLQVLVPRHLVVCALMNDAAIAQSLATAPASAHAAYRAAVGLALADERELAIARLRARGVVVVDAPAADLSVALLDAYLEAKLRAAF